MVNQAISNGASIDLRKHVLQTLLYYDIFNYPLRRKEILRFLQTNHVDEGHIQRVLDFLCEKKIVFRFGEFFTLQNNELLAVRRIKGNQQARKYLALAQKKARLIACFPFVRGVMASGSLSKGYMDEKSDLDFFIVTEPGRLWIARILLVLYKRIFLFNSHKYFCVNYFVDTQHLEIEEKNLFTATELATVIPLYGSEHYVRLFESNSWVRQVFPNHKPRTLDGVPASQQHALQRATEKLINLSFPKQLNRFFMNVTLKRWKRLYQKDYPHADFKVAFKTKDYASKTHPRNYQRKIMDLYSEKINEVNQKLARIDEINITSSDLRR